MCYIFYSIFNCFEQGFGEEVYIIRFLHPFFIGGEIEVSDLYIRAVEMGKELEGGGVCESYVAIEDVGDKHVIYYTEEELF